MTTTTTPITIGLNVTAAGAQPTPPTTLWANLIQQVSAINPGYTVLPGGLIEDLASTATYAIALCDSAAVETINSITPFGANAYLLNELGSIYGVPQGTTTNTSVYVVFTGTVGFQIPPGFLVSDGTYQYQVQDGGIIQTAGTSQALYCVATQSGSWAVPANTVRSIISSVPVSVTLSVTNPQVGTPSAGAQTQAQYAALVLQAGLVSGQGNASMAKTMLANVPGVQPRLIACKQAPAGGWEVICGGGDPYAVAEAIYNSGLDISTLVKSTISVTGITNANPGVVTTNINHGFTTGQNNVRITGVVGMSGVNNPTGGTYTVTVLSPTTFSFGVNTTSSGSYTSGGVVTPNARNISVNINSYPDTYTVPFVNPPAQTTIVQLSWNTISPNYVSATAFAQLSTTAIVNYINAIPVGAPVNLFALQTDVIESVLSLFNNNPALISTLNFTVTVNGIEEVPSSGTSLIYGDPESYFTITSSNVSVTQI
jgi:hypothetical protein